MAKRLIEAFWFVVFGFCFMGGIMGIMLFWAGLISGDLRPVVASIGLLYICALTGREASERM
ncbi:MAG: hypothetical protein JKY47_00925 [Thalassospira sp.]|jgi:hypothetical protein|uniref:hypothetical protein n=1 Tax=unclassified Thalassospira TaxID=2648997 RepID=UPI000D766DBB|nr:MULTISPECIES: hypothetical protein [unclassified Thalassospira]MBL4839375.1 hypothetical protein [Thalassospira sp.]PXX36261.1 hypothetical protein C7967_101654 [Thalassospira sp. 11-3]QPL37464.1 hypothetical protein IT971_09325 [Thalassospira sp. B30-1]